MPTHLLELKKIKNKKRQTICFLHRNRRLMLMWNMQIIKICKCSLWHSTESDFQISCPVFYFYTSNHVCGHIGGCILQLKQQLSRSFRRKRKYNFAVSGKQWAPISNTEHATRTKHIPICPSRRSLQVVKWYWGNIVKFGFQQLSLHPSKLALFEDQDKEFYNCLLFNLTKYKRLCTAGL